jgi:aflatoxin B1 aldehyde reductase
LNAFHERGYREIDTAANYHGSEARLGATGAPFQFIVHSKVNSGQPGDHAAAKIELSIKQSLNALRCSSVETMFLHVPDRQTPFEEAIKAMNEALQQGKFKQYGLSNYSASEVQDIIEICERNGYDKPAVFQGHYNAIVRGGEKELFPLLRTHSISFFAYR